MKRYNVIYVNDFGTYRKFGSYASKVKAAKAAKQLIEPYVYIEIFEVSSVGRIDVMKIDGLNKYVRDVRKFMRSK